MIQLSDSTLLMIWQESKRTKSDSHFFPHRLAALLSSNSDQTLRGYRILLSPEQKHSTVYSPSLRRLPDAPMLFWLTRYHYVDKARLPQWHRPSPGCRTRKYRPSRTWQLYKHTGPSRFAATPCGGFLPHVSSSSTIVSNSQSSSCCKHAIRPLTVATHATTPNVPSSARDRI